MIRRPPRSTLSSSSAASDVYKRQAFKEASAWLMDPANLSDARVEQAKLNLFAVVDAPNSPDSFGGDQFLSLTSVEVLQRNRERLLAMTADQIREAAPMFDLTSAPHCTVCLVPKKQQ
eukprot:TRINITY_DN6012_c0_g1_i3.p2 TRINITY_DN6012_c0_g1~~TRINITY_DN6012_c0_g1_i3.p2  ORF type:complete len:118 (+),score=38.31 TRINITY_DN6012_c0_g1_i3:123-476(+)